MQLLLVLRHENKVTTTSKLIADKFGKPHKDILATIEKEKINCSPEFFQENFAPRLYDGATVSEYFVTREGFSLLVMGFAGPMAAKFREDFINEFVRMEAALNETPVLLATYQERILSEPTLSCPDGYWCIFDESHKVLLTIEANVGSINKYDLADGSIGIRWMDYREGKPWAVDYSMYTHKFQDKRGNVSCKCFQDSEFTHFRKWLKNVYMIQHLGPYLTAKYKRDKSVFMLDRLNAFLPKLLNPAA